MTDRKSKVYLIVVIIVALISSGAVYFFSQKEVEEPKVIQITPKEKSMEEILEELKAPQEKYPPESVLRDLDVPEK